MDLTLVIFAMWIIAVIIVHELGHFIVAKLRGIYGGWGVSKLYAYVKLTTTNFPNRYDYLSGIILSLFTLPMLWLAIGWGLLFLAGLAGCFALGAVDLADCYFFDRIKRTGRWDVMNQINKHFLGLSKVSLLSLILFLVIVIIFYVGLPKLVINPLFLIVTVTICIAISLKATKWISKLTEILGQLDNR